MRWARFGHQIQDVLGNAHLFTVEINKHYPWLITGGPCIVVQPTEQMILAPETVGPGAVQSCALQDSPEYSFINKTLDSNRNRSVGHPNPRKG